MFEFEIEVSPVVSLLSDGFIRSNRALRSERFPEIQTQLIRKQ